MRNRLPHAPEPALRSSDQAQNALPGACDEERPLPSARRKIAGSTEGKHEYLEARPLYGRGDS
jgi:hypothetical protein